MLLKGKKAISPLISAVLLVVITVSIGAAVFALVQNYMGSGKKTISEKNEELRCGRDVGISMELFNNTYICNASSDKSGKASFNMILNNQGSRVINQVQLRVIGTKSVFTNNSILNQSMPLGASWVINVTYNPEELGDFRSAQVIPRITIPGVDDYAYCTDNAWNIGAMNQC